MMMMILPARDLLISERLSLNNFFVALKLSDWIGLVGQVELAKAELVSADL